MKNDSNIGNLFALSHEAVIYVENDLITYMNPPALALFQQDITNMAECAILPAHLLNATNDNFVASAEIRGTPVTVSRTSYNGQKLYSFVLPNHKEENDAVVAVSSNMREITNSIKLASDLITTVSVENDDPQLQEYSALLKHSTARMKRLVNNYALFSAFKQNAQVFNPQMVSITAICKEICEEVEVFSLPHNITMRCDCEEDLYACADEALLSQMILNLVSNSLNHIEDEGYVKIVCKCINNHILLSVEDNGTGIPQDILINVFKGYTKQAKLTEGTYNAGLGLSVADSVAKLHGGAMVVESKEKQGTKVTVQFPRVVDSEFKSPKAEYRVPKHEFIMTDLSTWLTWEDYLAFEKKQHKKNNGLS